MAGGAGDGGVRAGQRESRRVVIERGVQPCRSGMAQCAILRKIRRNVVRHASDVRGALVIVHMAAVAVGGQGSLVIVGMAGRACDGGMRAGQRKAGPVVIKGRVQPGDRRVTRGAILRESDIGVVGHARDARRPVVIVHMATVAASRQRPGKIVGVAGGARHRHMRAGQRKHGLAVVERGGHPAGCGVACVASCWEAARDMVRIGRRPEVLHVAAVTIRRRSLVLVVDVAQAAFQGGVHAREGVPGELQVVESHVQPRICCVTCFAGRRKSSRNVIRIGGLLEVRCVARKALRRQSLELPDRPSRMARRALQHSVRSQQREPVVVLLDLLRLHLPALHRVTLFTICSELAPVQVRVAIRTACACCLKHKACMALRAFHPHVHSTQRVRRAVVVEFWDSTDRFPTGIRVTVFARDVDGAVRIPARFPFYLALGRSGHERCKTNEQQHESHEPSP